MHGVAPRELSLESVSGDISANGAAPRVGGIGEWRPGADLTTAATSRPARSAATSPSAAGFSGQVALETMSGNMRVDSKGERLRRLSVEAVSGDADLKVALLPDGEISMESVSGDLALAVPRDLSAQVTGESCGGGTSAPDAKIQREEFGPGSSFHARYGAGKGGVRIETFSGDATLRLL